MRARDLLLTAAFAGLGVFGAWSWLAARAPEPAPQHDPAAPSFAVPAEPEARGRREAIGTPIEVKTEPVRASNGVPAELARKNSEAIEALERGEFERAVALFEACHAARPGEKVFGDNLAEACARLANREFDSGSAEERERSLVHMRRAHVLAPAREDVRLRLEQMEKLARSEAGFWTDSSEHFEISYDGERSDLLNGSYQIPPMLERAYQQFGEHFDVWPVEKGRAKIRVVLYRREGFHEATGIGHWAGGLFDGTVRVPLEDLQKEKHDLERVLRHEIAHAFVSYSGGANVPGWLNEGLAQYLEYEDLNARAARIQAARRRIEGQPLLELDKLQRSLAELGEADTIQLAYSQGLALLDHLERNFGERVLFEMVAGCKRSTPVETRFHERTGQELARSLADLAQDLGR